MMASRLIRRFMPLLILGVLALPGHSKTLESRWVLSANASQTVGSLGRVLQETLTAIPAGISLQGDVAEFKFVAPSKESVVVRLTKEAGPGDTNLLIRTSHGVFSVPSTLAPPNHAVLRTALDAVTPPVPWKKAGLGHRPLTRSKEATVDTDARDKILASRRRGLARSGRNAPATTEVAPHPISNARRGTHTRLHVCPACDANLLSTEPRLRLSAARALLRAHPQEVRIWSLAADAARRMGRTEEALAYADVATQLSPPDALGFDVWHELTGQKGTIPPDSLPWEQTKTESASWPLLLFLFSALALLLMAPVVPDTAPSNLRFAWLAWPCGRSTQPRIKPQARGLLRHRETRPAHF